MKYILIILTCFLLSGCSNVNKSQSELDKEWFYTVFPPSAKLIKVERINDTKWYYINWYNKYYAITGLHTPACIIIETGKIDDK